MKKEFQELFADLHSIKMEVDREVLAYLDRIESKRVREVLLYYAREGKRHLPWFTVLSAECLGGNRKKAVKCAALLEVLHKISLMVDDMVDKHDRRKGRFTPANIFGEPEVILAEVCGMSFVLRNIESEMGSETFDGICRDLESISGRVMNELDGPNRKARTREHFEVNRRFFRIFTEIGIAVSSDNGGRRAIPGKYRRVLVDYSEKIAGIATMYDDAEDVMIDMETGRLRGVLHVLNRFKIGRRISEMTEAEIKRRMIKSDGYRKMSKRIDALADEAVRSLGPLPQSRAKSRLSSLALFMKELHKEQKDMEIQAYIEKLFSNMKHP